MTKTEIIADSLNPSGSRLTTFILEYPRFIHSELMTHRVFSKNAASSRAIPIEKMIQRVIDNPAMPEFWGKNQSGMQANEELDDEKIQHRNVMEFSSSNVSFTDRQLAKAIWLESRDLAIKQVLKLKDLGLHKQISNRLLEPWFHIRVILSGTEFSNFFALRAHKDAQPEFRVLAEKMLIDYNNSTPKQLKEGEWHIPFGDKIDDNQLNILFFVTEESKRLDDLGYCGDYTSLYVAKQEAKKKIAIARCARVSYFNFEGKDDYSADIKLCDRLFGNNPKHLSPTEHIAQSLNSNEFIGNFRGFKQHRKFFSDEVLNDDRIIKKL